MREQKSTGANVVEQEKAAAHSWLLVGDDAGALKAVGGSDEDNDSKGI